MAFQFLVLSFLCGLLCTFFNLIYRLYFHPLAQYPGPWLAKCTDLYQVYHAWKGDRHLMFWRLHSQYGDIVRFGPKSLSFNTEPALKSIYGTSSQICKSDFYRIMASKNGWSTQSSIDKSLHARKRRVLNPAFSETVLKEADKYILSHLQVLNDTIAHDTGPDGWTIPQNTSSICNYAMFDIMGDIVFGKGSFRMLTSPTNRPIIKLIESVAHRQLIVGNYAIAHDWNLHKIFFSNMSKEFELYTNFVKQQTAERIKSGIETDRKDIFHFLLKAKDASTGLGLSIRELQAESSLMIIAGSDTASSALAATIFHLLHNSGALMKLQAEIWTLFKGSYEIVFGQRLQQCAYLRACIDEAMRLSPPVPGLMPRQVLNGGEIIDGHLVPGGTVVGVCHYAIHRNEDYFRRPSEYIPERWLPTTPGYTKEDVKAAQSAFCPFSIGPRGCIGKSLAYRILLVTLARIVFTYEMRLMKGSNLGESVSDDLQYGIKKGDFKTKDIFTSHNDGPMVEFKRRIAY